MSGDTIQVPFRVFISILFHMHLAITLWYLRPPSSMYGKYCDLHSLRHRKINLVWKEGGMFPGQSKTNHIDGFIKEPIKLSIRKWDSTLLKQIAQLTEVKFTSLWETYFFCDSFLSPKRLSGVEKGYVTRKLLKLCRFRGVL